MLNRAPKTALFCFSVSSWYLLLVVEGAIVLEFGYYCEYDRYRVFPRSKIAWSNSDGS